MKLYKKSKLQPMKPWVFGMDMTGISISDADLASGSPRAGDMIAQNPDNPKDQWLVAAEFFDKNYEDAFSDKAEIEWLRAALQCILKKAEARDQYGGIANESIAFVARKALNKGKE